ncbi:hypothetical protein L798_08529 [Zootermopsis nevadensis]|uniref:Uncharacterized protein n=1 Tax=Zootermopsis nevadensis TaxID=136037 RepID=A0A067R303_ZOONE|nr:hypothetical protein L798_08529 [Zootermopsis nevadensis]
MPQASRFYIWLCKHCCCKWLFSSNSTQRSGLHILRDSPTVTHCGIVCALHTFPQHNRQRNATGACGISSVAMAAAAIGFMQDWTTTPRSRGAEEFAGTIES